MTSLYEIKEENHGALNRNVWSIYYKGKFMTFFTERTQAEKWVNQQEEEDKIDTMMEILKRFFKEYNEISYTTATSEINEILERERKRAEFFQKQVALLEEKIGLKVAAMSEVLNGRDEVIKRIVDVVKDEVSINSWKVERIRDFLKLTGWIKGK